ncbi:hypothetical protein QBE52_17830 [Clostridiaceae bacterium 35-E11]
MGYSSEYSDFYASKTCKKCKCLITKPSVYGYCPKCETEMDEAYAKIRNHLEIYPLETSYGLQNALGISIKTIHLLLQDKRFTMRL